VAVTTATLVPSATQVAPGATLQVRVTLDPASTVNYAEKVALIYPADLLEATGFTFAPTWVALTQPGYDSIDNINGVMYKSAGYPAGFNSATLYGTASFRAKGVGTAKIGLGSDSVSYEKSASSTITGNNSVVTITAVPATVTNRPEVSQQITGGTPVDQDTIPAGQDFDQDDEVTESSSLDTAGQLAQVTEASEGVDKTNWAILLVVLLIGLVYLVYTSRSRGV